MITHSCIVILFGIIDVAIINITIVIGKQSLVELEEATAFFRPCLVISIFVIIIIIKSGVYSVLI